MNLYQLRIALLIAWLFLPLYAGASNSRGSLTSRGGAQRQNRREASILAFRDSVIVPGDALAASDLLPEKTLNEANHKYRIAADNLQDSISHQSDKRLYRPDFFRHDHRNAVNKRASERSQKVKKSSCQIGSLGYALRVGLSGGLAGAAGTASLFPLDTAKTLRQADPVKYKNVVSALSAALYRDGQWHVARVYKGVIPSTVGSIPSSALYFGAYESMKAFFRRVNGEPDSTPGRFCMHAISAASGNVLSSAIFVPKEAIKAQMQFMGNANIAEAAANLCKTRGFQGLYTGYKATLLRNIPTAALRFALYEEFRHRHMMRLAANNQEESSTFNLGLFGAGAMAGIMASALMTPVDVLKTRIATGTCPVDMPSCAKHVFQQSGFAGLYAGAGSRMLASGAFSAIGFGVFEACKKGFGVSSNSVSAQPTTTRAKQRVYTRRQRRLDHACSDGLVERKD